MVYVMSEFKCENPPCLHVVVDWSKKFFAVFLETAEGDYIYVPWSEVEKAYTKALELIRKRFREAKDREIDFLAMEYLGAEPIEEESEE